MTIAERRLLRICRAKAQETIPKHWYGGARNTWYGEPLHYCGGCGNFESHEKPEVLDHIQFENAKEEAE